MLSGMDRVKEVAMAIQVGRHSARVRQFQHPVAFWLGVLASATGVLLHLPMYFGTRDTHYRMAGMHPDAPMLTGMALILTGLLLALYGLLPANNGEIRRQVSQIRVRALDETPIRWPHVALLLVCGKPISSCSGGPSRRRPRPSPAWRYRSACSLSGSSSGSLAACSIWDSATSIPPMCCVTRRCSGYRSPRWWPCRTGSGAAAERSCCWPC